MPIFGCCLFIVRLDHDHPTWGFDFLNIERLDKGRLRLVQDGVMAWLGGSGQSGGAGLPAQAEGGAADRWLKTRVGLLG